MSDWWLDERAHAGDEHLDATYVAGYDRKAGYDPAEDVDALRRHGLGPGSSVLDLGAGTGVFACAVAPLCGQVVAVDVSPAMVGALRDRVAGLGPTNVRVVEAGFLSYEHDGESADFVFTRNALHQLPDFWKAIALDRIARLLRPGGVLRLRDLAYDFEPGEAGECIEAWFAGAVDDPTRGYTAADLAQHVRSEFSTWSWLLDVLLARTGFDVVERTYRRGAYAAYTCVRRVGPGA
jgi:ubiquinone/menaquinone biosynthesis C-methylase UbiE